MNNLALSAQSGELVDINVLDDGRDALQRVLYVGSKMEREDWLKVAAALNYGRQQFITESGGLNKKAFGQWCEAEGFGGLTRHSRTDALWLLDNSDSIDGIAVITDNNPTHIRKAYRKIEKQTNLETAKTKHQALSTASVVENRPSIKCTDYRDFLLRCDEVDLLLTDPPYSTDVDDIRAFAGEWLPLALRKVKQRAYICIGAYPKELQAYLDILLSQDRFTLDNPLIWTYRNTLGVTPKNKYNLNYQVILHLYTDDAPELDTSITNEMFSVQDINAPDGRQGDRFHAWQKPDELAHRLVRHSRAASMIDPFACTGTFLLSAAKHGLQASGCDIDREAVRIAKERGCG